MGFIIKIAQRLSLDRKGQASSSNLIATTSVAISLFVVTLAIAITGGFKWEIREKISGYRGDIEICARYADITDWRTPIHSLSFGESAEEIASISPVLYRNAILKGKSSIQGVVIKGMGEGYDTTFFASHLTEGRMPAKGSDEILLSKRTASLMNFSCGERINALFVNDGESDADYLTNRRFTICGLYDARIEEMDKLTAIADGEIVRRVNGWDSTTLSGYEIRLKPLPYREYLTRLEELSTDFERNGVAAFGSSAGSAANDAASSAESDATGLSALPINRTNDLLFNWLQLLNINVIIILALMIAVASFNMISGMLIMLFEKMPQIGLLKSMGMSNFNIARIFLSKAAGTMLIGMAAGGAAALLFCLLEQRYRFIPLNAESYFTDAVPIYITPLQFIAVCLICFAAIMAALAIPCHFIAKVSPAKSIKFN